jgi:glycosyltransferase involved in cell wall biosynthesis
MRLPSPARHLAVAVSTVPSDLHRAAVHQAMRERAARSGLRHVHVLTWRDLEHPEMGGSEVHAAHLCEDLDAAGLDVTLRTGAVPGAPAEVRRGGVRVVRRGGKVGVFASTPRDERRRALGPVDGIVEVFHGIPFFAPLWARSVPQVSVVHHVNLGNWRHLLAPPGSAVGYLLERFAVPLAYRHRELITIADSSREEVLRAYRSDPDRVRVALCGVDAAFHPGGVREPTPLVVAVARLVPHKAVPDLVEAFAGVRAAVPDARLVIVGDGPARASVEAAVGTRGLQGCVDLVGYVPQDGLIDWYRRAWVVASASLREGYGLTLTEAGACGTPSVATRIPGHVDAVVDGGSGLLVDDAAGMTRGLVALLTDPELRSRLGAGALAHAAPFRWEHSAKVILDALCDDADRRR